MPVEKPNFIERIAKEVNEIPHLRDIIDEMKKNPNGAIEELREKAVSNIQEYRREGKTAKLKNNPQYQKLLGHVKDFSDVRPGDVLSMKKQGENIGNFLMTDIDGGEVDLSQENIGNYIGQELKINFGVNRFLNARIGLGDLFPQEVKKVEVTNNHGERKIGTLGYQDSRRGRRERVGFYDENGLYIPVYSNFSVKILEIGSLDESGREAYKNIEERYFKDVRMEEMVSIYSVRAGLIKTSKEQVQTTIAERFPTGNDALLFEEVAQRINKRVERSSHVQEAFREGIGTREKFIGKFGWYLREVVGKDFPNIPAHMIVNLIGQESKFRPNALNGTTGAYGFGQITPSTWSFIEERMNKEIDRENPYDQVYATAHYLDWIMKYKKCDTVDAIIYYHMGPNVDVYMRNGNMVKLEEYKKGNPAIERNMRSNSWDEYWNAARKYYTEAPGLLTHLDLSKSGTELAVKLGDFVMSTSLPNTGDSSCGKAVGELLIRFGIEELPTSGRDGNKWDSIFRPRVENGQFKKVAISHPDEAQAGGIITFDGTGILGSEANKDFGHVEIKGSDGAYYSYYEGQRPGGSAATSTKNPEEYRKLTGFTGYVYYPVTKTV